ncbi:Phosphatidylinositol 3,4,5-trisphosphate-dependent Rac exchanger 2 protein [Emydomyces testavorans]|uniref:Phosphatidylinositol 3,4,5-trisphosphate-dependent Rac exchanger 2 protein n=1 Tax=Emydomyces testavorans TaxID=2070801 RepID=A0AAF0IG08_9EURO|nr:Phosphatidylinositol 3,4,5-trisphosphate-dependent Rac exchanger 2 protein [Emydomyces testavorans]
MLKPRADHPCVNLQMTGLNPETDHILQISCFITDADLNLLDHDGFHVTVHQPPHILSSMDPWCISTHGRSGLTAAVHASTTTPSEAANSLLSYVQSYVPRSRKALLAGNSVHADRVFLAREPYTKVVEWLHYRILDVSSVKEAVRRWSSDEVLRDAPGKVGVHLAKDDILESIEEMRFYSDRVFQRTS